MTEYNFNDMTFEDAWPEIQYMVHDHLKETLGLELPVVDYPSYTKACRDGLLKTFVVFYEREAVGYCTMFVMPSIHDTRTVIAFQDGVYIRPDHRNGVGRRFIREVDNWLADHGVNEVRRSCMLAAPDAGHVYSTLKYSPDEVCYVKHLTKVSK